MVRLQFRKYPSQRLFRLVPWMHGNRHALREHCMAETLYNERLEDGAAVGVGPPEQRFGVEDKDVEKDEGQVSRAFVGYIGDEGRL